jgi:hypothetical protein
MGCFIAGYSFNLDNNVITISYNSRYSTSVTLRRRCQNAQTPMVTLGFELTKSLELRKRDDIMSGVQQSRLLNSNLSHILHKSIARTCWFHVSFLLISAIYKDRLLFWGLDRLKRCPIRFCNELANSHSDKNTKRRIKSSHLVERAQCNSSGSSPYV